MTALADRVKESTTTTGTGSLTLSGAVAQFESFNTAFGTAAPFYYVITDANGTDWEVGTGELSNATTLVRTTVHQSSNADAKINLSAGTHTVFCSAPAVFLADLASKSGKLSQFAATTSAELAGVVSDETGSGALVFATSPTLTTPNIGVATATSVNGTTIPSSKTLVVTTDKLSALAATTSAELAGVISDETGTGSLVFASSPSLTTPDIGAATATSVNGTTIPSSKTLVVTTDKLSALAATTSAELAGVISDETGSGSLVFATSPSLTTPNIGTPSAGTLTNCTGLPVGGVSGLGTGVGTALAVNTGSAGAFVVNGGALGTPSSGTLTNATGLPVSTGVSGLGTGVATALAVNTGSSGAVVVNGGALGTPSSGTVTNLTGTASININGTVGATTANTGAFTTLSATGVATFSAGTAAAPAITTSGDTNNGIYFPAADNVAITTGGTQRLLVTSAGDVGIGGTPNNYGGQTCLTINNATGYSRVDLNIGGVKKSSIYGEGSSNMMFETAGSERMRIDSSGNVGIGTSSPATRLEVASAGDTRIKVNNTANTVTAEFGAAATETFIAAYNSKPLTFYTGGSDRMVINSSGNVGIGTSSPSEKLHVVASTSTGTAGIRVDGQYGSGYFGTYSNYPAMLYNSSGLKPAIYYDTNNNYLICWTNNTERMRIDSSGNVLVGTTNGDPVGSNVAGIGLFNDGRIQVSRDGNTPLFVNRKTNDGDLVAFYQDGAQEGSISVSGNTVSYNAFAGSHWSQLQDGSKPDILRGTVMESINEMCEWPNEENERLPKCKISDTAGSKKVYGVFMAWDNDWTETNDLYVTSVGAFICRVNGSVTVQEGDLLESNGDGTARVQADDIIRSSTIGKVTSTVKSYEYDDGSYCVPTVLYCG